MKLRFYLRGLGIGIIFSALICSFGRTSAQEPMSDSEIIARAKELGMVEGTVLSQQAGMNEELSASLNEKGELVLETNTGSLEETNDIQESLETEVVETLETQETTQTGAESDEIKESEVAESSEEAIESMKETLEDATHTEETVTEESKEPEKSEPVIEEPKPEETPQIDVGEKLVVTVKKGSGSYTVAQSCEAVGLVQSARDFDDFLCANGYANRISVGDFEISAGSDYETIAKILTHSK